MRDEVSGGLYHRTMVLEELHELIETLQGRIAEHGSALQQSEALTRYGLIDPLLRGLGWDTGNPSAVLVEVPVGNGKVDYALLDRSGKRRVVIEAKKLGESLSKHIPQVIGYCIEDGIEFCVLTDGRIWEVYRTFDPKPFHEKLIARIDLNSEAPAACLNALALWRPSVVAGQVKIGLESLIDPGALDVEIEGAVAPISKSANEAEGWHSLSGFTGSSGTKPASVHFPDGTVVVTPNWADFIAEIVRWLKKSGALNDGHLPIPTGKGKTQLVNTDPVSPGGKQFNSYRQVDTWYVNATFNAKDHVRNARRVIQVAQPNAGDFAVRLQ